MPIVLLGFMGVGKTTTVHLLNLPVYDMDHI
ncbi:shikimate kinase, partial [Klebsiella variicola]